MADGNDVRVICEAVRSLFPRHPFTDQKAAVMLDGIFKARTHVTAVVEALTDFARHEPDASAPEWERIAGNMRRRGTIESDSLARMRKSQEADRAHQDRMAAALAIVDAIPDEQWPEVCERARLKSFTKQPLPEHWRGNAAWVFWLRDAANELRAENAPKQQGLF